MLEKFFNPQSIAVIGASRSHGKVGFDILKNIIQYDFKGKIYPVNPNANEIMGLKSYPSVLEVPDTID